MSSVRKGDDPAFDLPPAEIDALEARIREEARNLLGAANRRRRNKKLNRANEISRKKSKRAHKGTD
jgi:hypothetical protein